MAAVDRSSVNVRKVGYKLNEYGKHVFKHTVCSLSIFINSCFIHLKKLSFNQLRLLLLLCCHSMVKSEKKREICQIALQHKTGRVLISNLIPLFATTVEKGNLLDCFTKLKSKMIQKLWTNWSFASTSCCWKIRHLLDRFMAQNRKRTVKSHPNRLEDD